MSRGQKRNVRSSQVNFRCSVPTVKGAFLHGTECCCASLLCAMLKSLFLTLNCQKALMEEYHKSWYAGIQREQKQAERCRKSSSGFMPWEVDASCSHCQDCEDDDPGMAASRWVTGVCIYGPKTQHLTCLAPKPRTCATPHWVPE